MPSMIAEILRTQVAEKKYIDVGKGAAKLLGVSDNQFRIVIGDLVHTGYRVVYIVQENGDGHKTTIKVLTNAGISYNEVFNNRDKIGQIVLND